MVCPFAAGRGRGVASTDRPGRSGAAATGASSSDRRATHCGRRSVSAGRGSVTSGHGDSPAAQPSRSASRSSTFSSVPSGHGDSPANKPSRPASRSSDFRSASSGHGGAPAEKPSRSTSRSSTSRRVTFREGSPRAGRASPSPPRPPPRPPRRRNQHNQRLRDIARAQVYWERCEQRWAEKAPRPLASDGSSASVSSGQVTPGVIPSPSGSGFPTGDPARSASSPAGRSWTVSPRFRRSSVRDFPAGLCPGFPGRNSDVPGPDCGSWRSGLGAHSLPIRIIPSSGFRWPPARV